jgi:hypothetical protein
VSDEGEPKAGPTNVEVSVADDRLEDLDAIAEALADAGLREPTKLRGVGVITGSVDDTGKLDALREVDGVKELTSEGGAGVPSPDEPVQ